MDQPKYIGFHAPETLPIKNGDTIVVPKGTTIHTTMPKPTGEKGYVTRIAGKTYKVKIDHILPGMTLDPLTCGRDEVPGPVKNPSVRWAGTGGYWFEVDINDVHLALGTV